MTYYNGVKSTAFFYFVHVYHLLSYCTSSEYSVAQWSSG